MGENKGTQYSWGFQDKILEIVIQRQDLKDEFGIINNVIIWSSSSVPGTEFLKSLEIS